MSPPAGGWLPEQPVLEDLSTLDPWLPSALEALQVTDPEGAGFRYAAVDEVEEGIAELIFYRWPRVDAGGRLRFHAEGVFDRSFEVAELQQMLDARRLPAVGGRAEPRSEALQVRPVIVGDVYALRLAPALLSGVDSRRHRLRAGGTSIEDPVVDISIAAREAALGQAYAAAVGVLGEADVEQIALEFLDEDGTQDERVLRRTVGPADPTSGALADIPLAGGYLRRGSGSGRGE